MTITNLRALRNTLDIEVVKSSCFGNKQSFVMWRKPEHGYDDLQYNVLIFNPFWPASEYFTQLYRFIDVFLSVGVCFILSFEFLGKAKGEVRAT